jgi:rubrerythrin
MTACAPETLLALRSARAAEKKQAAFYRALAVHAEAQNDDMTSERLNGLHADEQHHLSRITARLVELGETLEELSAVGAPTVQLEGWEQEARRREQEEVARYETLLLLPLDDRTADMLREFLDVERRHATELGGKWMVA